MKGIVLRDWEVRGIQDGRKSRITRVLRLPKFIEECTDDTYTLYAEGTAYANQNLKELFNDGYFNAPYKSGDILFVRETWKYGAGRGTPAYQYKADFTDQELQEDYLKWHPSIHIPKEAARIFLRVTGAKVERLQDITDLESVAAECFNCQKCYYFEWCDQGHGETDCFMNAWNHDHLRHLDLYGYDKNPWVYVYEVERVSKEDAYAQRNKI